MSHRSSVLRWPKALLAAVIASSACGDDDAVSPNASSEEVAGLCVTKCARDESVCGVVTPGCQGNCESSVKRIATCESYQVAWIRCQGITDPTCNSKDQRQCFEEACIATACEAANGENFTVASSRCGL